MRSMSGSLLAHLQQDTMTMCLCFKVTRDDGQIFRFTGHDQDLVIGADTYDSDLSFSASQMEGKSGLAIDNGELTLPLATGGITKADVLAGLFYKAGLDVFWVNWADTAMGVMYEARGWLLGRAIIKEHRVVFEVRSLAAFLNAPIVDVVEPTCPYVFGLDDGYRSHCPADLDDHKVTGTVTAVDVSYPTEKFDDSSRTEATNEFQFGKLTWTSGNNSGYSMEVQGYNGSTKRIDLLFGMPYEIEVGDAYEMWYGCNKSYDRCIALGAAVGQDYEDDFGGEPKVPSQDKALQYRV